jgi:hypothetical protein
MERKGKQYKGKSDDLVNRNAYDVPIINLWIRLFIKHMQHYEMTVYHTGDIYIYNISYNHE